MCTYNICNINLHNLCIYIYLYIQKIYIKYTKHESYIYIS